MPAFCVCMHVCGYAWVGGCQYIISVYSFHVLQCYVTSSANCIIIFSITLYYTFWGRYFHNYYVSESVTSSSLYIVFQVQGRQFNMKWSLMISMVCCLTYIHAQQDSTTSMLHLQVRYLSNVSSVNSEYIYASDVNQILQHSFEVDIVHSQMKLSTVRVADAL